MWNAVVWCGIAWATLLALPAMAVPLQFSDVSGMGGVAMIGLAAVSLVAWITGGAYTWASLGKFRGLSTRERWVFGVCGVVWCAWSATVFMAFRGP